MKRITWLNRTKGGRAILWLGNAFNRNTGFILMLIIIIFGFAIIGFQKDNQQLLEDTKKIAENTEQIVAKQDETLAAIQNLALDNKISGDELKEILLCMLVVPPEQRTTDTANDCRKQADASREQSRQDSNVQAPRRPEARRETSSQSSQPRTPTTPDEPEDDAIDVPVIDIQPVCLPLDLVCIK